MRTPLYGASKPSRPISTAGCTSPTTSDSSRLSQPEPPPLRDRDASSASLPQEGG
jgi:hypothetical protein